MPKVKVQKTIWELWMRERWEQIRSILKDRRDELAAKAIYNTGIDTKVYSEADYRKLEIRVLNRLLKLNSITVEVDENLTEEEILQQESDAIDIWDVDELFKTQDV